MRYFPNPQLEEEQQNKWKYCVVGNIVKSHVDENGILRFGTAAFTGGTKVYIYGKYWLPEDKTIKVLGLNRRGRKWQVHTVPVKLIESVRCSRAYNPAVLKFMNNWESIDGWWHESEEDKTDTYAFVQRWLNREAFSYPGWMTAVEKVFPSYCSRWIRNLALRGLSEQQIRSELAEYR